MAAEGPSLARFARRRVLLLQGPNGPFFSRFAAELFEAGAEVFKIQFNAADALFYRHAGATPFRGTLAEWPAFLASFLETNGVEFVFLFGDGRPLHRAAIDVVRNFGATVYVFEEGYLRPDFVTVELGGVNRRSAMPRDARAYEECPAAPPTRHVRRAFAWSVWYTIGNALAVTLLGFLYPRYRHHRDVHAFRQAFFWARSGVRRVTCALRERGWIERLRGELSKKYFLVALQVHNDTQVRDSRFSDVTDFIREVVDSFARAARPTDHLVFKHHPADRAYRDYTKLLGEIALEYGLVGRVIYVHDLHLPTLLRHARGTVVINSTVGFSSLYHQTPVLTLAESFYGFMGLVSDVPLDVFWCEPPPVDAQRVLSARHWLIHHNQANGSIWTRLPHSRGTGLVWPRAFAHEPEPRVDEPSTPTDEPFLVRPTHAKAEIS